MFPFLSVLMIYSTPLIVALSSDISLISYLFESTLGVYGRAPIDDNSVSSFISSSYIVSSLDKMYLDPAFPTLKSFPL